MKSLSGRVAVVIGAAGGIGGALAERLAQTGCHLALVDVDGRGVSELAERLLATGCRLSQHTVDITDESAVAALAEAVERAHGGVDLLINSAGVNVFGSFEAQSSEDFDWLVQINFFGVVYACRHFLGALKRGGGGHIVNIASVASLIGLPMQSSYSASKYALRGFGAALRVELSPWQVGVTTVMPGAVRTRLMLRARSSNSSVTRRWADLMMRRALRPERLAERILRAVRQNRAELVVGPDSQVTRWLQAGAPWLARWLLNSAFARYHERIEPRP